MDKIKFDDELVDIDKVKSFMFRIDTHDKSDEWFEYY